MDQSTLDRLKGIGLKLAWSPHGDMEGLHWVSEGIWYVVVMDPAGGYWTAAPERSVGADGKKDGPDGALLTRDKPEELVRVLREAGCADVRLFKFEEKTHLCPER